MAAKNGSKWLIVGSKKSWPLTRNIQFLSGLPLKNLQQNATHRTNFFEGVVDGVTIPGGIQPMVGSTLLHMKCNETTCETCWTLVKRQRSDWCKQWIAERPQTNQQNTTKCYAEISHSQNTEFDWVSLHHPKHLCIIRSVSMVSWSFELELEHWEDV